MHYQYEDGFVMTFPEMIRAQGPVRETLAEAESDLPRLTTLLEQEVTRLGQQERLRKIEATRDFATGYYFARGQIRLWPPDVTPETVRQLQDESSALPRHVLS